MLKTATTAAKLAGEIIEKYFGKPDLAEIKAGNTRDHVTIADREAEAAIKKCILDAFPTHGFWGEETGRTEMSSDYVWVVDPLDGTSNYILNLPLFGVSVALMYKSEVILGVVYLPKTKELFAAEKGKGATCNGKHISVSQTKILKECVCAVEYYSKDDLHIETGLTDFVYFARKTKKIRYLSSTAFDLCRVAKGDLDLVVMDTTFLDIAAAKLIVEEAGGVCTSKEKIIAKANKKIIRIRASNPHIASKIDK